MINKLKQKFKNYEIDGYIIPKNDEFFSEYANPNRLKIISKFSGSAGMALVLKDKNFLYVDGRSGLRKTGKPIRWLDDFISENQFDIASWQTTHKEMSWTNGDIISAFNLDLNSELLKTGQFAATFHAWRKNIRSLNFLNEWLNFLLDNYDQDHVDKMKEILQTNFDFDFNRSEEPDAPFAAGAYAGGTSSGA